MRKLKFILILSALLLPAGAVQAKESAAPGSASLPGKEEGLTLREEEPPQRDSYPYFSAGGRAWLTHLYRHGRHQGTLDMYGGELNVDITDKFGIGGTFMKGNSYLRSAERHVNRTDLDVALKYQFCRYLTGYLDFKRIDYDYKFKGQVKNSTVKYQETLNGIGFGLASALPIAETGFFVYLGGGFTPFINFSNYDPYETHSDMEIDYLYNAEGGVGYFLPTRYVDIMATAGYRFQAIRMIDHVAFDPTPTQQPAQSASRHPQKPQPPQPEPNPVPVRENNDFNSIQDGIICGIRINW